MNTRSRSAPRPAEAGRRVREALAAQQRGELAQAEEEFRRLTETFPGFAGGWHYYGLLCLQRGERERAVEMLRRAQTLAPNHVAILVDLGRILAELGEYSRAIGCSARVLALAPDNEQALIVYAQALVEAGRGGEAIERLERGVRADAANWRLWALLGKCREQANDRAGAQVAICEAVKLAPEGEAARRLRSVKTAMDRRDTVAAELEFRAALGIEPHSAAAFLRLANLAMEAGEFPRAREWAREAVVRDERLWRAWALLAADPEIHRDDTFLHHLEETARRGEPDTGVAPLHFALGSIHERRGEFEEAFAAYALGNRIQGRRRFYDRALQETYVANLVEALDENFTKRAASVGVTGSGAVFICGMPRSGTTLVEAILASHPKVFAGGEMRFLHDWLQRSVGKSELQSRTGSWLSGASDAQLHALAREWRRYLGNMAGGAAYITDKMPGNYHFLGLIHACFPDAAIICVSRDPRDSGLSCFTTCFERGHFFSHDLESIGHYYRLHDRMMDHWRRVLGPGRLFEIEYESLVSRPEEEIRRLLAALKLEWDPACMHFYDSRRGVRTASQVQIRQPLYRTSVGRWRHFEIHLGPLLDALTGPVPAL